MLAFLLPSSCRSSARAVLPWGFVDKELEDQYLAYYWLTFAQNNKRILSIFYGIPAVWVCIAFTYHLLSGGRGWETTGMDIIMFIVFGGLSHLFSLQHMPHVFKKWFTKVYRWMMWFIPVFLVIRGCSENTSRMGLLLEQFQISIIGGWTCPHWTHHTLNLFAIDFIPLAWKVWHAAPCMNKFDFCVDSIAEIEEMAATSLVIFVLGIVFNGVICVEHRCDWLKENRGRSRRTRSRSRSRSRSHSPSQRPASSRSCSPAAVKKVGRSPSPTGAIRYRQQRSVSPATMPRLEE